MDPSRLRNVQNRQHRSTGVSKPMAMFHCPLVQRSGAWLRPKQSKEFPDRSKDKLWSSRCLVVMVVMVVMVMMVVWLKGAAPSSNPSTHQNGTESGQMFELPDDDEVDAQMDEMNRKLSSEIMTAEKLEDLNHAAFLELLKGLSRRTVPRQSETSRQLRKPWGRPKTTWKLHYKPEPISLRLGRRSSQTLCRLGRNMPAFSKHKRRIIRSAFKLREKPSQWPRSRWTKPRQSWGR